MPLPSSAHAAVQAQVKAHRTAWARANRVRVAGVRILHATDAQGTAYTFALGDKEPTRAYLVWRERKTQAWSCGCFVSKWKGVCPHAEAAECSGQVAAPQGLEDGEGEQEHAEQPQSEQAPEQQSVTAHAAWAMQNTGQEAEARAAPVLPASG